jgi:hypothetical protein
MKNAIWQGVGLGLAMCSTLAVAAGEIKLQLASSIVSSKYGISQQSSTFEANVANLAYNKQVFAHYKQSDGTWVDLPLSYNRSVGSGREIWSTSYSPPLNSTIDLQFALKYVVNGQTYWDNNNGNNHFVPKDSGAHLGAGINVYNLYYQPTVRLGLSDQYVYGAAALKNLAVLKDVTVVYSTDNWTTTKYASASYSPNHWAGAYSSAPNPNAAGFEVWPFSLNVGTGASQVDYAIRYTVNGEVHWDNNGGQNYRSALVRQ